MFSVLFCACAIGAQPAGNAPNWIDDKDFPKPLQERALAATLRLVNPAMNNCEGTAVRIKRFEKSGRVYYLTAAHNLGKATTVNLEGYKPATYPKVEANLKEVDVVQRWDNQLGFNKRLHNIDLALLMGTETEVNQCLNVVPEDKIPKRMPFSAVTLGCSGGLPPVFVDERVLGRGLFVKPDGTRGLFWQAEKIPAVGRSGCPLVDTSSYVIGICSGTGGQRGYYVDAEVIRDAVASYVKTLLELDAPAGKGR